MTCILSDQTIISVDEVADLEGTGAGTVSFTGGALTVVGGGTRNLFAAVASKGSTVQFYHKFTATGTYIVNVKF